MAAIDYGTGPNTASGDTMPSAINKLRDRLAARGFSPGDLGSDVSTALARIETALQLAEAAYTPGTQLLLTLSGSAGPATVGAAYSFTPSAYYATGTVTYTLTGTLPAGLTFDPATGTISGTPTGAASFSGTISAADSKSSAQLAVSFSVSAAPVITPAPAFTTQPSISPASGPVGTVFTLNKGTASNATTLVGRVLLNGAQVTGDVTSYTSQAAGSLTYEVTATGPTSPPAVATSAVATVSVAAPAGTFYLASGETTWPTGAGAASTSANRYRVSVSTIQAPDVPWSAPGFAVANAFRSSATVAEDVVPQSHTLLAQIWEMPNGTRKQQFFGGQPTVAFTGGTLKYAWPDDDTSISGTGGEICRLIQIWDMPVGTTPPSVGRAVVPAADLSSPQGGDIYAVSASDPTAAILAGGALPASLPAGTYMEGASPLGGFIYTPTSPVVLALGDSITEGYRHRYVAAASSKGHYSYGIGLNSSDGGRLVYGNLAASSTRPSNLSDSGFAFRKAMLAAKGYGFNVALVGSRNGSPTQTDLANMYAFVKTLYAAGKSPPRVVALTLPPNPSLNNNDGGSTLAGQTADTSFNTLNTYIKGLPANVDAVVDIYGSMANLAGAAGKFPVPGFSTTLSRAASVGDTTIYTAAAPTKGDMLVIGAGLSSLEQVAVLSVAASGTGDFAVTLQTTGKYTALVAAHASGVTVAGTGTDDGLHPSSQSGNGVFAASVLGAKKAGLFNSTNSVYAVPAPATPAPAFTSQPSISPSSGTAGTTTFTATPGTVSNGTISSRAWKLASTTVSTGLTYAPDANQAAGTLTYQEFATGSGGNASSTIQSATLAAATVTPTPSPTPTLPATNQRLHYDFSDTSKLYQDSARTTAVTADGQPVQSVTDTGSSADGNATGTAVYKTNVANGKGGVLFNGTTDTLQNTAAGVAAIFSGTNVGYTIHWVEKVTQLPAATAAPWSAVGSGFSRMGVSTAGQYSHGSRNDAGTTAPSVIVTATGGTPAVGEVNVWSVRRNTANTVDIFKNGTLLASGSTVTGAVTLTRLAMGSSIVTNGTAAERFWPGIMLEWVGYTGAQADSDVAATVSFLKTKFGIA